VAVAASSGWGALHSDCLQQVFSALLGFGDRSGTSGMDVIKSWAAVLSVNSHWRGMAQEVGFWPRPGAVPALCAAPAPLPAAPSVKGCT
jgi:hypothetical protein